MREPPLDAASRLAYKYWITDSLILLLVVPPFVAGLGLVFWQERTRATLLTGSGLIALGVAGWIDVADNCVVGGCDEDDPVLLTTTWAFSVVSLVVGSVSSTVRALTRRRARR